jgi:methionyl-tRNA formyltransferase
MTNQKKNSSVRFVFFGTVPLKAHVLAHLATAGCIPARCVESEPITKALIDELSKEPWDVFIVASYGYKIPKEILALPAHGVVNVHPSLLPRLRGASPIRSAILNDEKEIGVSIIVLDDQLDHGPIIAQKKVAPPYWPMRGRELDELLAHEGGALLTRMLPAWLSGEIEAHPQNDDVATFCHLFKKEDGLLDLHDDAHSNLLKIRAFEGWPGTYTYFERAGKKLRVQILDAHVNGNKLVIDKVKPEGKREMGYEEFLRSGAKSL